MKEPSQGLMCHLRSVRQARGLSQSQLAELVGVKRQAIYDMESGRYAPNTALALKLARHLRCRVEDLFVEEHPDADQPITIIEEGGEGGGRVAMAKVRGRLVGYPLGGMRLLNDGFRAADGLLRADGHTVRPLCSKEGLDRSVLLLGCDPAFSILGAHVARCAPEARLHCRFASSHVALQGLAAGHAHMAGTHLHNTGPAESNAMLAQKALAGTQAIVVGFSLMEEGLMVARGNPHGIRTVADLARESVRMVNREPGAALRILLDDCLARLGVSPDDVEGYGLCVSGHMEGAQRVAHNFADAAPGLRAIAAAHGLDFVPLETVRCDLVVPADLLDHPTVKVVLELLQTRSLRDELDSLPGYESSQTGRVVAEI